MFRQSERLLRRMMFLGVVFLLLSLFYGLLSFGPPPVLADPESSAVTVPPGNPVEIAAVMALGFGFTPDNIAAVQMAIDAYGPIKGFAVQHNDHDGGCSLGTGADVADTIVNTDTQTVGVIGPTCSSSASGAAPVLEAGGVVMVSHAATGPDLPTFGSTVFNRLIVEDPATDDWFGKVSRLPSVRQWKAEFEALQGHPPEVFSDLAYDATFLLLTRIDEVSTVDGGGNLVIDRAALAAAVRGTGSARLVKRPLAGLAGVTGDISLDGATGNRVNWFTATGPRYVSVTGDDSGGNDCTNPAAPCASVGRGLALADNGGQVFVAEGTYTETLQVPMTVTIEGGYEATGWTRDIELHPTIVDGDGADAPVVGIHPGASVTVEGLVVQGANHTSDAGGGFLANGATVVISATVVQGNAAAGGGGMYVEGDATLSLINSLFAYNTAVGGQIGGLDAGGQYVLVQDTGFTGNSGSGVVHIASQDFDLLGGQVFDNTAITGNAIELNSSGTISGTEVFNNTGAAVVVHPGQVVTAHDLTLRDNTVAIDNHGTLTVAGSLVEGHDGGWATVGSWNAAGTSHLVMAGCILNANTTSSTVAVVNGQALLSDTEIVNNVLPDPAGGAIVWLGESAPGPTVELVNVLVAWNVMQDSPVVRNQAGSTALMNVTLSKNQTTGSGNIVFANDVTTLTNVIVWGNTIEAGDMLAGPGALSVTYSDVEGGWPDTGNIDADPRFLDPTGGDDYHLWGSSPCRDTGTPVGAPSHDIEGTPRDDAPDMGAYEWIGHHVYAPVVHHRPVHILVSGESAASDYEEALASFEQDTGIDLVFEGVENFEEEIVQRAQAGTLPDLALFPQPGLLADLARDGHTLDLYDWFSQAYLEQQYKQTWLDMATVDGEMAGIWYKVNVKSLVWYPKDDFDTAGYTIPQDWAELVALSDQMVLDGRTPWCIGIDSGPATGWVGTDWIEDIMLRTTTPENYDAWVRGDLAFASAEVKNAWELMGDVWFATGYALGGRPGILNTHFGDAPGPLFGNPPGCWLHRQGSFITGFFPEGVEWGVDYDYFYFPPIDAQYDDPVLMAGDLFGVFRERPATKMLAEYLTTGESARWWAERAWGVLPHNDADPGWYPPEAQGYAQMLMDADTVRFDASDLMPGEVGAGAFWDGVVDYVNGVNLDYILYTIDQAWPN
jgi:alpha-glucoside transport system substrate-binding protein